MPKKNVLSRLILAGRLTLLSCVLIVLWSCKDNALINAFKPIDKQLWRYSEMPTFQVKVQDNRVPYELKLNLRLTADYRYANLYVLVHQIGPDHHVQTKRVGLVVADKDGRWLGKGVGNLFSYQISYDKHFLFPDTGTYTFKLEQNMRDNPLRGVSDVGIVVAPSPGTR